MKEQFKFNELTWVTQNGIGDQENWTHEDRQHIQLYIGLNYRNGGNTN